MGRTLLAVAVGLAVAGALPAAASASTICVNTSPGGCDSTFNSGELQNALDAAASNPGHDRVLIGPGTYSQAGGFSYDVPASPINTIDIVGAGVGQTTITATSADDSRALLVITNRPIQQADLSTLSDLTVQVPAGSNNQGLAFAGATAVGVAVTGPGMTSGAGVVLGGVFASGSVSLPTGASTVGVLEVGVDATLQDSLIVAADGVVNPSDVGATTYVRRSEIQATRGLLSTVAGTLIADNVLVRLSGAGQVGALSSGSAPLSPTLNGDHLTIVGNSSLSSDGVQIVGPASATVTNSIIRGVDRSLHRDGTAGAANLTVSYSDYGTNNIDTGAGTLTEGPGNLTNIAPVFVGSSDFHLQATSPLIDAGDPAACGGADRDGGPRVVDGNGDGSPRTDIGAFEYQSGGETCPAAPPPAGAPPGDGGEPDATPPDTAITKHPKDRTKKKTATFEFTSSEAGSTFECRLDETAFEPCTSPKTYKVKRGKHSFQVHATDPAGNVDGSPAADDWKVRKGRK